MADLVPRESTLLAFGLPVLVRAGFATIAQVSTLVDPDNKCKATLQTAGMVLGHALTLKCSTCFLTLYQNEPDANKVFEQTQVEIKALRNARTDGRSMKERGASPSLVDTHLARSPVQVGAERTNLLISITSDRVGMFNKKK